ncbi:hypothetical protein Tco_0799228 [Tanacetum coccineum]
MECSSCRALYNKSCGCSKGGLVDKFVRDPNKTPESSQRPPILCVKCGNPVEGPSCQGCALWRKKLKEMGGECGDSLDGIFCQRCTCKSCGKGAHIGYNCPPKAPIISNPEPCNNQTIDELPQTLPSFDPTYYSEKENSLPYVSKPNFVDDSPNVFNPPPQPPMYSCEFCGNDARYGHYCTPQVPFIYPEPCYNQDFNLPQDFHDFQQQYLCCENCGGPHEAFQCQPLNYYEPNPCYDSNYSGYDQFDNSHPQQFLCCENCGGPHEIYQCQPMNEDYYHEQNSCYDPNSFGFDQFQPPQYTVNHPLFNDQNDLLNSQNELFNSQNKLMEQLTSIRDMVGQYIQKKEEEKRIEEEQAAKDRYWKIPVCYDDDDDEESSIPLKDIISELPPCVAITPDSPKTNSLIMEDEHLDTIPETESDELIKSSVEDLVQIPSESEDSSEGECDLPPYDDSSKNHDLTFSNPLFDIDEDFTSSDESFSEEDVPNENFKIFSNPLFDLDEEITSTKVDQIDDEFAYDDDTISEMFTDEHALDYSSPPLWDDYDDNLFDLETVNDDTYDDPFDSKEEKIKDSKILIDELDLPGSSDFLPFPECDSVFYEDFSEVDTLPSTDNEDKIFNPGILIHENLFEVTNLATPEKNVKKATNTSLILEDFNPPLYELPFHKEVSGLRALLSFSSKNEEKVFNPGILTSKRVHTSFLPKVSHRGTKAFKVIKILESSMEIFPCSYGEDIRILDVPCLHFYPLDQLKIAQIVMTLVLAVLSSDHLVFTSSASFGNPIS